MRLFAVLLLPQAAVDRLLRLRLRLGTPQDGLRWSTPEQWHITLQFYGEVNEGIAEALVDELSHFPKKTVDINIEKLGLFPAKGILLASVDATHSLLALQAAVENSAHACGISSGSRAFHPHITLARSKGKQGDRTLKRLQSPELPAFGPAVQWQATELVLLESRLSAQGATYHPYAQHSLCT